MLLFAGLSTVDAVAVAWRVVALNVPVKVSPPLKVVGRRKVSAPSGVAVPETDPRPR